MSIDRIQPYFGLARPPFGADLAPGTLHRFAAHSEATARIAYRARTTGAAQEVGAPILTPPPIAGRPPRSCAP
jgi:hypothetical protein